MIALVLAAVWLGWRLVASLSWRDLGNRMAAADHALLGAALGCIVLRYLLWDHRLRLATGRAVERRPRFGLNFFVLFASAALNLITPSARVMGAPLRARYVARSVDRPFASLYGVILFDQLAHYVVMTTWTALALVAVAWILGRAWLGAAALLTL